MSEATALRLTESQFQRQVTELAEHLGWRSYHTLMSRGSNPGFPDLILVRGPRLLAAELKTDRGRLTDEQRDWLQLLEIAGAESYVWRPRDWNEIVATLKKADQP